VAHLERWAKDRAMTTEAYIGYLVGALILIPAGALIARYATAWIAGFRPRFTKALVSTIIAYVVVNLVGFAFQFTGSFEGSSRGIQFLVGLGTLSCCHVYLLRSEAGDRLSPGKAIVVAICQTFGAVVALMLVLLLMLGVKRLFA
jgi:hypothetical protein